MISYCKDIDITDQSFIEDAIWDCLRNRKQKEYYRKDVQRIIAEYGTIDVMAQAMRSELQAHSLNLLPTRRMTRKDKSNGKLRDIDVEDIWQQFFDYVAVHGLKPAMARIGYYQCGCMDNKGQVWGAQMIFGFAQKNKYAVHCDMRKCYPSVPQDRLFAFFRKIIRNKDLVWLIEKLTTHTTLKGIAIGSRLSITLIQLYLSQLYHHMTEECFKIRRGKRINLIEDIIIFMDDIYLFGNDARNLHMAVREMCRYSLKVLGLEIKDNWTLMDCAHATIDAMGFRVNREYIKMRRINYLKTKKSLKMFRAKPCMETAQELVSRTTNVKYTDSFHFRHKYHWKQHSRNARRLISRESKILNAAGCGCSQKGWQYGLLPDRPQ